MFDLPVFVELDYHENTIQVCVMNQTRKNLLNTSVEACTSSPRDPSDGPHVSTSPILNVKATEKRNL